MAEQLAAAAADAPVQPGRPGQALPPGELVADGDLEADAAGLALTDAAAQIGLVREDGPRAVTATIRSGFQRTGVAYDPPR